MSAATKARSARARATIAIRMLKTVRHLGRAFDDCFEMYDGDEVVRWILDKAKTDPELARIIAERGFGYWFRNAEKSPEQEGLLPEIALNQAQVRESVRSVWGPEFIAVHQVAVYVIAGGGHMGRFAAEHPADLYIDDRVGRLPFSRGEILHAADTLVMIAKANGLDPHNLPPMPLLHSFGIF